MERSLRILKTKALSLVPRCQIHGHPKENQAQQGDFVTTLATHLQASEFWSTKWEFRTNIIMSYSDFLPWEGRGKSRKWHSAPGCPVKCSGKGSKRTAPEALSPSPGAAGKQTIPKALRGIFDPVFILQNGLDVGVGDDNIVQF